MITMKMRCTNAYTKAYQVSLTIDLLQMVPINRYIDAAAKDTRNSTPKSHFFNF